MIVQTWLAALRLSVPARVEKVGSGRLRPRPPAAAGGLELEGSHRTVTRTGPRSQPGSLGQAGRASGAAGAAAA